MTEERKLELVKKLEDLAAFQQACLDRDDWENFDKTKNEMEKLEQVIVRPSS